MSPASSMPSCASLARCKAAVSPEKGPDMERNKHPHEEPDLLSDITDVGAMRVFLADLHDDLLGKVARFRYLADLGMQLGSYGTMLYGGHVTYNAWIEARSSFVHGNALATILLCQSLA